MLKISFVLGKNCQTIFACHPEHIRSSQGKLREVSLRPTVGPMERDSCATAKALATRGRSAQNDNERNLIPVRW